MKRKLEEIECRLLVAERQTAEPADAEREVEAALSLLNRLPDLAANASTLPAITEAIRLVNARLFLRFQVIRSNRRQLNKVASGVLTFGNAPGPALLYGGPTGRRALQLKTAAEASSPGTSGQLDHIGPGQEGNSLGNVSRGNWTPVEPFLAVLKLKTTSLRTAGYRFLANPPEQDAPSMRRR